MLICALSHLIFPKSLPDRYYYYIQFTDENMIRLREAKEINYGYKLRKWRTQSLNLVLFFHLLNKYLLRKDPLNKTEHGLEGGSGEWQLSKQTSQVHCTLATV